MVLLNQGIEYAMCVLIHIKYIIKTHSRSSTTPIIMGTFVKLCVMCTHDAIEYINIGHYYYG